MDFVRLRGEEHRFSMPVKMILCVYSRSDKHLISKMEKPKVANFNWNFLVKACYSFLSFSFFPNCLFGCFSEVFSFHFISFLILHLKWWAVGSFQFWSKGPRLPSLSTLCLHPFCRRCVFSSPLSSGFFSVSFFLLSPLCGVLPCLALSLASGCLTREYYPNAEKEVLNQVRQWAAYFRSFFVFIKLKNLSASNFNWQKLEQAFHLEINSLEAAQELMVAVRDLRRTVRLVQSGCVTFFSRRSTWAAIDL